MKVQQIYFVTVDGSCHQNHFGCHTVLYFSCNSGPPGVKAREFYEQFVERVKSEYVADKVKDGVFGGEARCSFIFY